MKQRLSDAPAADALRPASQLALCGALLGKENSIPIFHPTPTLALLLIARFATSLLYPTATPPTVPLSDVALSPSPRVHGPPSANASGLTMSARPTERFSSSSMERALSMSVASSSATALLAEFAECRYRHSLVVSPRNLPPLVFHFTHSRSLLLGSKLEFASPKNQDVFFSDFSVAITRTL